MKNLLSLLLLVLAFQAKSQCGDCPPEFFPFCHGVASGDPWPNSVILWTRVTPEENEQGTELEVEWEIASDPNMLDIEQTGTASTNADRDYTLKFELDGLSAGTSYYYRFIKGGAISATGRTRTAPEGEVDKLRLGVASCSKYNSGYFNGYGRIADRNDLDAVIILGDYMYEYAAGIDGPVERANVLPAHEILTLEDYRCRHAFYKLDRDMFRMHQQHPVICTWDDHEIANNAWETGAANHTEATEGNYQDRRAAAWQAYFEWMPVREDSEQDLPKIYRKLNYGNLAEIIMLDTRHEGRDMQAEDTTDVVLNLPDRTIMGDVQREWFLEALESSTAKWKVIGNQVVFSPLNTLGFLDNMDAWDGYPAEREKVVSWIDSLGINDIVFLTGDIHIGIAADVSITPFDPYDPETGEGYNPENGDGAVAVEMVCPSISSNNLDEANVELPIPIELIPTVALAANPHGKFVDFVNHGYFVLDLNEERAQSDWYWVATKEAPTDEEYQTESWYTLTGENFLQMAETPAPDFVGAAEPAPEYPLVSVYEVFNDKINSIIVSPNPASGFQQLSYELTNKANVTIELLSGTGQLVRKLYSQQQQKGKYQFRVNTSTLTSGVYQYAINIDGQVWFVRVVLE